MVVVVVVVVVVYFNVNVIFVFNSVFGHGCLNLRTMNMVSGDVFLIRTLCHLSHFYNGAHTLFIS